VISRDGGLLKPLSIPFKIGAGAKIGSGKQWMAGIALADWLAAAEFLLEREDVAGPVNIVGQPCTNTEFTRAFAQAVHRPAVLAVPGIVLDLALGEMAGEVKQSQRVAPRALERAGFEWTYPDIRGALAAAFDREAAAPR
jgi:NAD dependent epimerase/dehydratase family enzyme